MSTGQSKPMGLQKKEYEDLQQKKADEDFKYNTNQRIQNLQFAIEMINKSLAGMVALHGSDKNCVDTQISQVMEATMSSLKEFRQELGDMASEMDSMKSVMIELKKTVQDLVPISMLNEKISRLEETIQQVRREKEALRKDFKDQLQHQFSHFCDLLKSLKTEILNAPSEIPAMKKLFDQKLEIVELNGQNAVLRSSNNERQLQLIEKKIENIYQLLKRIEITHQESK